MRFRLSLTFAHFNDGPRDPCNSGPTKGKPCLHQFSALSSACQLGRAFSSFCLVPSWVTGRSTHSFETWRLSNTPTYAALAVLFWKDCAERILVLVAEQPDRTLPSCTLARMRNNAHYLIIRYV
jgi:hypothetical protein